MVKLIFMAVLSACAACRALAIGASQEWVRQYVSNVVSVATSSSGGVTTYTSGSGTNRISLMIEDATVYALRVTNATASAVSTGVTNGMYLVWNDAIHSYTNGAQTVTATTSNLVWGTVQSSGDSFTNWFDVVGTLLQPSVADTVGR